MFRQMCARLEGKAFKSWIGIAGLWGAGLLPCPDCGVPMLFHFWPLALALTLVKLRRGKQPENAVRPSADTPVPTPENGNIETN
jgi:hypothetical protein